MTIQSVQNRKDRDPDLIGAEAAIRRAADKARQIARVTGTAVVYMENGKIREEMLDITSSKEDIGRKSESGRHCP